MNNPILPPAAARSKAPDNIAVHASDSGRSDRKVDLNKRLIKRSTFLKVLGGMGVAMMPAASAFAYGGCATGSYYAQYYAGVNFNTLRKSRCEAAPLDKNWGTGRISPLKRSDNISARWTGSFQFEAGTYEFTATADDGIRVYVDGVRIIDEWRDQAQATFKARRQLKAGIHQVRVEYYEKMYDALCSLTWTLVSSTPTQPPARELGATITSNDFANYGADINAFNAKTGYVHPIMVSFDRFGEYGFDYGKMEIWAARNIKPVWTWQPFDAVTLATINAGNHDAWIDEQANLIARFPDMIVYVRFAQEMNGDWFPWGQQPTAYKAAFQRVADRVRALAPNARMVWCPNVEWPPLSDYYPGNSYVDWLAFDGYNFTSQSPSQVMKPTYDIIANFHATKPFMIAETGCREYAGKPNWISTLYTDTVPNEMPRVKAVCWFDVDDVELYPLQYNLETQADINAYKAVADRPEWGWGGGDQG